MARRSRAAGVEGPALLVVGEVVTAVTGAAVEGLGVEALEEIEAVALWGSLRYPFTISASSCILSRGEGRKGGGDAPSAGTAAAHLTPFVISR
jgi:hypothetical protein